MKKIRYLRANAVTGRLLVAAAALTLAAPLASARAKKVSPADFTGTWKHAGSMKEKRARRRAIDGVVQTLPVVMRGRARRQLAARTTPPSELKLKVTGDRIVLTVGGHTVVLRFGAKPITVKQKGEEGTVKARFKAGRIVVVSKGGGGRIVTRYRLLRDGKRFRMKVRIKASPLRVPLVFKATYQRK